ncbi:hypothetical protein GCM10010245_18470 [Streptomyces spectabilis]|nr:hypothetical protein GCM10010245_18470 [Streptomyces spectabilis]
MQALAPLRVQFRARVDGERVEADAGTPCQGLEHVVRQQGDVVPGPDEARAEAGEGGDVAPGARCHHRNSHGGQYGRTTSRREPERAENDAIVPVRRVPAGPPVPGAAGPGGSEGCQQLRLSPGVVPRIWTNCW